MMIIVAGAHHGFRPHLPRETTAAYYNRHFSMLDVALFPQLHADKPVRVHMFYGIHLEQFRACCVSVIILGY
jgi:hypothetical protein